MSRSQAGLLLGVLGLVAVGIVNALGLCTSNLIIDDAFIFFRYAENLVAGHGLLWNPGEEPVEGYSSFLYVVVLAALRAVGAELVPASHVLNVGLFLLVLLLPLRSLASAAGGWSARLLLGPLLLASSVPLASFSRGGMETMLFAALLVATVGGVVRGGEESPRRRFLSGIAFGLVALTRPEGILLYVGCLPFVLLRRGETGWRIDRGELARIAGVALVVLPHLAWRLAYYGDPLPNTFYAKVGFEAELAWPALRGFLGFLGSFRGGLAALALLLFAVAPRTRAGGILAAQLVLWIAFALVFLRLPDWTEHYTMPVDLFAALSIGWSTAGLLGAGSAAGASATARLATVGAVACATLLFALGGAAKRIGRLMDAEEAFRMTLLDPVDPRYQVNDFIAVGRKLAELGGEGDSVAVGAVGAIAYYSGMTTYDTMGLNDRHIARRSAQRPGETPFGHAKGDGAYILGKRPTFIVQIPWTTAAPNRGWVDFSTTSRELVALSEFDRDYEFRAVRLASGKYFNYYARRDSAAGASGG